jgi:hypothetical protein
MRILLVNHPDWKSVKSVIKHNTDIEGLLMTDGYNILAVGDTKDPISLIRLGKALGDCDTGILHRIEKLLSGDESVLVHVDRVDIETCRMLMWDKPDDQTTVNKAISGFIDSKMGG